MNTIDYKTLNIQEFNRIYHENEQNNLHSENVLHMALYIGTEAQITQANSILYRHDIAGHLTSDLECERKALKMQLNKKLLKSHNFT